MKQTSTIPLTIVIPVKNEEANLARCLQQLERFSEVIVVDSSSTDRTPEIARQFGATYLDFKWDGQYPKKRNWVLLNQELRNEWVLFLDADEIIDVEFAEIVAGAITQIGYVGYWLNYTNYFLGIKLNHGLPQRKLAMFRKDAGLYERIEEQGWSQLDMEIHEHPVLDGKIGEIDHKIEHNDDRGIIKFINRHRDYAMWEAERVKNLNMTNPAKWDALTNRQRFKYKHITKWWYSDFYFLFTYFARLGFLDGQKGYLYASYKRWYFQLIRILYNEHKSND